VSAALLSTPGLAIAQELDAAAQDLRARTLMAAARRIAAGETLRDAPAQRSVAAASADECRASWAEKLAFLYALVGGSVMLITGPGEREGGEWTVDGKSETVAGAAAVVLSFALLKDIRHKRSAHP
jgi:hypothetical protein